MDWKERLVISSLSQKREAGKDEGNWKKTEEST